MDGQSHGATGMAKLLTGHEHNRKSVYRIDHTVPYNLYRFDDTQTIRELKGIGHSKGRDQLHVLEPAFFDEPADQFTPIYRLNEERHANFDKGKYSRFLENVVQNIDIPPSKYQQAVDRYSAVGRWLEDGAYKESVDDSSIYPQGSFRLGTVVRPIRGGIDADYDIDLVCELPIPKQRTEPRQVKVMVGDRLREHTVYCRLLDDEGKRCWTLEYKEQDGIGFHLDVLPSVPDPRYGRDTAIAITDKRGNDYSWSASDPQGFGGWFDSRNRDAFARVVFALEAVHL